MPPVLVNGVVTWGYDGDEELRVRGRRRAEFIAGEMWLLLMDINDAEWAWADASRSTIRISVASERDRAPCAQAKESVAVVEIDVRFDLNDLTRTHNRPSFASISMSARATPKFGEILKILGSQTEWTSSTESTSSACELLETLDGMLSGGDLGSLMDEVRWGDDRSDR